MSASTSPPGSDLEWGSLPLSVVVIAHNEEARIGRCLASVGFARERIVLDGGSTDATADIARALGARVEVAPDWPGFGPQKNRAIDLATQPWVLSLDADEWVGTALAREIAAVVADPRSADIYDLPRRSSYCGRVMRHSGWWPDPVTRLWRRGRARFTDHLVHERLLPVDATVAPIAQLRNALDHEAFTRFEQVIAKMNRYSSDGAEMLAARGRRGSVGGALAHGLWTFIRTWVLRGGFLDGRHGLMLAISNAEGSYYRHLKLMLLQAPAACAHGSEAPWAADIPQACDPALHERASGVKPPGNASSADPPSQQSANAGPGTERRG